MNTPVRVTANLVLKAKTQEVLSRLRVASDFLQNHRARPSHFQVRTLKQKSRPTKTFAMLALFVSALLLAVTTPVAANSGATIIHPTPVGAPTNLTQPKWYHWLYKVIADDTDRSLQKNGLNAKACTVAIAPPASQAMTRQSYPGIAPCLVDLFVASMKTDQLAGNITTWFSLDDQSVVEAKIFWRPEAGGWRRQIKTLWNLQFEDTIYWLKTALGRAPDREPVDPAENLLGHLSVQFENDPEGLRRLFLSLKPAVRLQDTPQAVTLDMKTIGRKNGYLEYDLQLTMGYQNPMQALTMIHVKSNINLTRMRRRFQLSGQQVGTREIQRDEIR